MTRQLLLLDVTQMSGSNVCVAGVDVKSGTTVRLADPSPTRQLIRHLGDMRAGDLLQLDYRLKRRPSPPHVEDAEWEPRKFKRARTLTFDEVCDVIGADAFPSIEAAFGPAWMKGRKGNSAWRPDAGTRSLATIRVVSINTACEDEHARVRLIDLAQTEHVAVPFQDFVARSHECDSCTGGRAANIAREFDGQDALIRVGLTRPFAQEGQPAACWLQVTNIFARPRTHFI